MFNCLCGMLSQVSQLGNSLGKLLNKSEIKTETLLAEKQQKKLRQQLQI